MSDHPPIPVDVLQRVVAEEIQKQLEPVNVRLDNVEQKVGNHETGLKSMEKLLGSMFLKLKRIREDTQKLPEVIAQTAEMRGIVGNWDKIVKKVEEKNDELEGRVVDLEVFDRDHDARYKLMLKEINGYGEGDDTRVLGVIGKTEVANRMAGDALSISKRAEQHILDYIAREEKRKADMRQRWVNVFKIGLEVAKNPLVHRLILAITAGGSIGVAVIELLKLATGGQ